MRVETVSPHRETDSEAGGYVVAAAFIKVVRSTRIAEVLRRGRMVPTDVGPEQITHLLARGLIRPADPTPSQEAQAAL